ncbi:MAG: bifunctional oligoribonuclease/PAP phosphatase NrnA [Chthoniobacterales bacterium]
MSNASFAEIAAALRASKNVVVISHVRPDGDAFGSQLGMALSLRKLGKHVTAWNEDGLLEKYSFLPGSDIITKPPAEAQHFDLAIALDTAVQSRLGTPAEAVRADKWINIDHHPTNPRYGDLVYIDPAAPATGQILFELLAGEGLPIERDIAENLFVAISTDTGSFQYPSTTARTFEIGAELLKHGVDVGRVSQLLYESYPRRRVELLRDLLGTMEIEGGGKVATFSLSLEVTGRLGVEPEDNEGLIDHLRAIEGVVVAVFFEELLEQKVRVSMRSKSETADVAAICQQFGGGGHKLAAGARVRGTLVEVKSRVMKAIRDVVNCNS